MSPPPMMGGGGPGRRMGQPVSKPKEMISTAKRLLKYIKSDFYLIIQHQEFLRRRN